MKLAAAAAILLVGCGAADEEPPREPAPLRVMTFNVLCSLCGSEEFDPWEERLAYFGDIFARHDPDLIGIQELTPLAGEVEQILEQAPGRAALYFAPESGLPYPDATIVYRTERFEVLEHGEYWLSPTPDEPRSTGFADPQLPRLLVWARLADLENDGELYFASTHFDNNVPSQELSAPLVKERTLPYLDGPVVVVGDFNAKPPSPGYEILMTEALHGFAFVDTFDRAAEPGIVSNQEPVPSYDTGARIDHVLLAGTAAEWTVEAWAADLTVYGPSERYPSDHFPIAVKLATK